MALATMTRSEQTIGAFRWPKPYAFFGDWPVPTRSAAELWPEEPAARPEVKATTRAIKVKLRRRFLLPTRYTVTSLSGNCEIFQTLDTALRAAHGSLNSGSSVKKALAYVEIARSAIASAKTLPPDVRYLRAEIHVGGSFPRMQSTGALPSPTLPSTFLIDWESSHSFIDRRLLASLALRPLGAVPLEIAGHPEQYQMCREFDVSFFIPGPRCDLGDLVEACMVLEAEVSIEGCQGILGRDILSMLSWGGMRTTQITRRLAWEEGS